MVETKLLLEDEELDLLEDILDGFYLSCPQEYSLTEKMNLQAKLEKKEVKVTNEEIFTVWKALSNASQVEIQEDKFESLRGKFEQLNMMLSY